MRFKSDFTLRKRNKKKQKHKAYFVMSQSIKVYHDTSREFVSLGILSELHLKMVSVCRKSSPPIFSQSDKLL